MTKALVILICACAVAHAQFNNNRFQSSFGQSSFGQTTAQPQYQGFNNQYQQRNQQPAFQSRGNTQYQQAGQYQQASQYQQAGQYQQRSQYQSANQVQQGSAGPCREKNDRYPVPGSCDRYVECLNGTSEEKLCPDGLRYNPNVNFNVYPCQYPNDVPCLERSSLQPPQPTEECPHQFGYFRLGDARNCSGFRNCVNGVGFDQICPEGLAFSSQTYRCEWPDEVEDCDAEAFLGFRCPEIPISKELGPPAGYRFYRSDTNCQKYFICINNRPRLLTCGGDSAFDELTSTCVSADEISACPAELRDSARRARDEEQQRLARELAIKNNPLQQKRRF